MPSDRSPQFARKAQRRSQIELAVRGGLAAGRSRGIGGGAALLLDTLPLVRRVLQPQLRAVSLQLLSPRERADLRHAVEVMVDLGLVYVQTRAPDGTYQYHMEPNVAQLSQFPDSSGGGGGAGGESLLSYTARQLIAREVELEKMRRVQPKPMESGAARSAGAAGASSSKPTVVPNHLQTLAPKRPVTAGRPGAASALRETVTRDFFGRMSARMAAPTVQQGGTDVIVKSPIWYRYKEGCNNAVRKDITIASLL